jgi:hypothetical protein
MHSFLNIPGNECFYTDTDSIILKYPLDETYVGSELGQFKFLGKIKRGYFIAPKLYCLISEDDKVNIKSKGLDKTYLNESDFKDMLFGMNKKIPIHRFVKDIKQLSPLRYTISEYVITPKINKRIPIYKNKLIVNTLPYTVRNNKLFINSIVKYNPNKYALV